MSSSSALHPRQVAFALVGLGAMAGMLALCDFNLSEVGELAARVSLLGLVAAAALHGLFILLRCESWRICLRAADATVSRRVVLRCGAWGFAANSVNGQIGSALRLLLLRRAAPEQTPTLPTMVMAEVPVLGIEAIIGALLGCLVATRLGLPLWLAPCVLAALIGGWWLLGRGAATHKGKLWKGLAVLRGMEGRRRLVLIVAAAMACQLLRTWLLLSACGLSVNVLDAAALMLGVGILGQLPVGPGAGAGVALLLFGSAGAAAASAAGVLLSATALAAALVFCLWAALDSACCAVASHVNLRRLERLLPRVADTTVGLSFSAFSTISLLGYL